MNQQYDNGKYNSKKGEHWSLFVSVFPASCQNAKAGKGKKAQNSPNERLRNAVLERIEWMFEYPGGNILEPKMLKLIKKASIRR